MRRSTRVEYDPDARIHVGELRLRFVQGRHYVPAWGVVIDAPDGSRLAYTGDTGPSASVEEARPRCRPAARRERPRAGGPRRSRTRPSHAGGGHRARPRRANARSGDPRPLRPGPKARDGCDVRRRRSVGPDRGRRPDHDRPAVVSRADRGPAELEPAPRPRTAAGRRVQRPHPAVAVSRSAAECRRPPRPRARGRRAAPSGSSAAARSAAWRQNAAASATAPSASALSAASRSSGMARATSPAATRCAAI